MRMRNGEIDVVVVGTGPNGLAAALILAKAGLHVQAYDAGNTAGGGARTAELTLPGFQHDVCSTTHPLALASPFFQAFNLAAHGVKMLQPEIAYAHPLDSGRAGLAWRDLNRAAEGLGRDGPAWRSLLTPMVEHWESLVATMMSDFRRPSVHPATITRFSLRMLEQSPRIWRERFHEDVAPALLAGVNMHAIGLPRSIVSAGVGLFLATLAHTVGWPLPAGGSQSIVNAIAAELRRCGGQISTGRPISTLAELPRSRVVILNVSAAGLLRIAGRDLPSRYVRWLRRFCYGAAACKVDFALAGPVPWASAGCDRAGTLHLVGTRSEALAAERAVAVGQHHERPYVLAVQPSLLDLTRAPSGCHTFSTYAHVPQGSDQDVSETVIAQVDRFAPGVRDLILGRHVITGAQQELHNPNYVGGDIASGALTLWQTVMRPVPRWDPYTTPLQGVYLCSAATPPGPGVHGMAGVHVARRVLRREFGIKDDPLTILHAEPAAAVRP